MALKLQVATDAQQREILRLVLDADKHWPMRPQASSNSDVLSHQPLVALDTSFAFGAGNAGNVYPDPSCRDDAVGKAIADEGGQPAMEFNQQSIDAYPKDLGQALVRENELSHGLPNPHLPQLAEISANEVARIFRAKSRDWSHFFQSFPDAAGYVQVTRAVLGTYKEDQEEALIYVYEGYRPGCGSGTLYTLFRSPRFPSWLISSAMEPSGKPRPTPSPAAPSERVAHDIITTGPNAGKVPDVDVHIQLVKDQRTVDLVERGEIPEDFTPDTRQEASTVRVKLADSPLRFVIVMRNTGKKLWPRGTSFDVIVRCDKDIAMAGGLGMGRTLKPGEFDLTGASVKCPAPSSRMSIRARFETGRAQPPGDAYAAALDVQLLP
jgi:hypothetical protein